LLLRQDQTLRYDDILAHWIVSASFERPAGGRKWHEAAVPELGAICIVNQNLRPLFLAVRTAAPQLLQAGNGSVIAIASMYGLVGQYERVAYCGAKAGMIGMVRAMALDIADGRRTCA
jgi:NAD(P)-dependent dehydrogenase (short-subunit alcohol dehydrogenase family)